MGEGLGVSVRSTGSKTAKPLPACCEQQALASFSAWLMVELSGLHPFGLGAVGYSYFWVYISRTVILGPRRSSPGLVIASEIEHKPL